MFFGIDHHWFEAFHVIAVTAWMVGMFYLPRLYAYHAGVEVGSQADGLFRVMEARLLRYIMTPAMIIAVCLGVMLAFDTGHIRSGWLHLKLLFVFCMLFLHWLFWQYKKKFSTGSNTHSARFYKIINEVVTAFFIAIVILAFTKPF